MFASFPPPSSRLMFDAKTEQPAETCTEKEANKQCFCATLNGATVKNPIVHRWFVCRACYDDHDERDHKRRNEIENASTIKHSTLLDTPDYSLVIISPIWPSLAYIQPFHLVLIKPEYCALAGAILRQNLQTRLKQQTTNHNHNTND